MTFCDNCANLLEATFIDNKMILRCVTCALSNEPSVEDTLRKQRIKEPDVTIHQVLRKKAYADPTIEKIFLKCRDSKCSGTIAKMVRVGVDGRLYNICVTCKTSWLNM